MRHRAGHRAASFLFIVAACGAAAFASEPEPGFEAIFDGRTLDGWDGDPRLWRVQDGAITGETTADNPILTNTFLIWRRGDVEDFELTLQFRIVGGNSGVQFRSFENPAEWGRWVVGGYQADIDAANDWTGSLYGERFRGVLGVRGEKTVIGDDHKPVVVDRFADRDKLRDIMRVGDWNDLHIVARGPHIVQRVNGRLTVDFTDNDRNVRRMRGLIALQLHAGPPMKVQFRDIRLKRLPAQAGKHIVLISGDEEYRSEEALVQLGRLLEQRHGFRCTVLFAVDPKTGEIDPLVRDHIPGLEALETADLMIIATRFRDLPDAQMKHVADYVDSGRPVLGLRTATHAFQIPEGKTYARYSWDSRTPGWEGGFGRRILGETWVRHHGLHGSQSTRGVPVPAMRDHPILRGCDDIWGPTDVYEVRLPLPGDSRPLVLGQVIEDMTPTGRPVAGKQNDPMMPIAWTRTYVGGEGRTGRVFTTTMGASVDLQSEGFRRLLVNATYWCVGLEDKIPPKADVDFVGDYRPTPFGFGKHRRGLKPADVWPGEGAGARVAASRPAS